MELAEYGDRVVGLDTFVVRLRSDAPDYNRDPLRDLILLTHLKNKDDELRCSVQYAFKDLLARGYMIDLSENWEEQEDNLRGNLQSHDLWMLQCYYCDEDMEDDDLRKDRDGDPCCENCWGDDHDSCVGEWSDAEEFEPIREPVNA